MQKISPDDLIFDIQDTIKKDQELILSKLPAKLNEKIRADKWFNFISGDIKDESRSERRGQQIEVFSNPIGAAFDLSGNWKDSNLSSYIEERKASGYYKKYMKEYRAGIIKSGKFKGNKRLPFLAAAVYRVDQFVKEIIKEGAV